ncbi:MAG: ABC transporter permease [Acidobacteria bacterium]|nr:ABC transporter permease [Acidobacteriota bacterium]
MHALQYCLNEASRSLWRQRGSSALSMLTIAAAALVVGGFLLVTVNLNRVLDRWSATAEVSIYLRDDITQEQRVELNRVLVASDVVASRVFVSKADALARFKRDFPDLSSGLDGIPDNPLPASLDVRLRPQGADSGAVEALAQQVQRMPGVADVRFDRRWLARLSSIILAVQSAGWVLGCVLIVAAVLTVSTVVRLALHARRDEIEIMQLVGAPLGLLRGPLVTEGTLHGGVGSLVALAALYGAYVAVKAQVGPALAMVVEPEMLGFLPASTAVALLAGGMAVGSCGGWLAARHVR